MASRPSETSQLTRKDFLRFSSLTAAWVVTGCGGEETGQVSGPPAVETTPARLARIIREYDLQGIHRTGTDGDNTCARWLADEAAAAGVAPELEPLPFSKIELDECYVELADGTRIDGIPMFDSPPTDRDGIRGRLGHLGGETPIGVAQVPPSSNMAPEFYDQRASAAQAFQLAVTGGPTWGLPPGYALINAEHYTDPVGPPVLQLPSQAWERVSAAAEAGETARCVSHFTRRDVEVYNTTATIPGRRPELPPLVVMTPRSGWWNCASERGGGIAIWVELVHELAAGADGPPERTTHFVASTGHELGHFGLDHYLASRQEWIAGAVAWIHLGANFAAAVGSEILLQTSDEAMRDLALGAMKGTGFAPDQEAAMGDRPLGEARNIFDGGGRYLSLLGRNGLFHHPDDRWPEALDMARLERIAGAFTTIVRELVKA